MGSLIIFYALSGLLILSGLMVVFCRNPVRSAVFLVLCFVLSSPLWIMVDAEFLGLVLVFVYVGAVMTLFLFVVMMLNLEEVPKQKALVRYFPLVFFAVIALIGLLIYAIKPALMNQDKNLLDLMHPSSYSNVKALGAVLYTDYVYQFEIAAVLLLVAIVSAISLTFRGARQRLVQNPESQIKVQAKDRLTIVKMPSEKRV